MSNSNTNLNATAAHWHTLTPSQHAASGYIPFTDYRFTAKDQHAALLQAEIPDALAYFPLAFIPTQPQATQATNPQNNESKQPKEPKQPAPYQLVVLQSLTQGLNLYVDPQGKWLAPYVPAVYRGHPFRLHQDQLQINTAAQAYVADIQQLPPAQRHQAKPLFANNQQLTENLQGIHTYLQNCQKNQQLTDQLITQLHKQDLIIPLPLQYKKDENAPAQTIEGYYRIDEDKLKSLQGLQLSLLAQTGALALAYGQLYSLKRLQDFGTRYARHQNPQANQDVDLEQVFGEGNDDVFKF